MKVAIAGLIVAVLGAYIASVLLYANGGIGHRQTNGPLPGDVTVANFNVEDIQSNNTVLVANLTISPGPALLDPQTHRLAEELSVAVTSVAQPTTRTWSKDVLPGVFPVPLTLSGQAEDWPFDSYHSGPITVELFRGAAKIPEPAVVTFTNRLPGWRVDAGAAAQSEVFAPHRVELRRSTSTAAFAIVIVTVLVVIAAQALFVAVQTLRNRRPFQPPMTTWYAAMLFAVVPLRNALPGSPPFGSWIDVTVVLWVIVLLVVAMLLYIACWWHHLRPHVAGDFGG